MTVGKDTKSVHIEIPGKRLITSYSTEDQQWMYSIVLEAVFHEYRRPGPKIIAPTLRNLDNVVNGFATMHKGDRYLVVHPSLWIGGDLIPGQLVLVGHELGHHVCGHLNGLGPGGSVERELEADRFAGSVFKALRETAPNDSFDGWVQLLRDLSTVEVLRAASDFYSSLKGGGTHPQNEGRIAAFQEGYLHGSDCVARTVLVDSLASRRSPKHGTGKNR
jgi:hypothetical protein